MNKGIIAVDFDGTIVDHVYPYIGKEKPRAVETLIDLKKIGWKIIIWTCRESIQLEEAIEWLKQRWFSPDAVNENIEQYPILAKHKIVATYYFDDRSFPAFPGWDEVRRVFLGE